MDAFANALVLTGPTGSGDTAHAYPVVPGTKDEWVGPRPKSNKLAVAGGATSSVTNVSTLQVPGSGGQTVQGSVATDRDVLDEDLLSRDGYREVFLLGVDRLVDADVSGLPRDFLDADLLPHQRYADLFPLGRLRGAACRRRCGCGGCAGRCSR